MTRLPDLARESMTTEQRSIYDQIISGPRGMVVGPLKAALFSPKLAEKWSPLGEYLRYRTDVEARLSELAILVTARRYSSQMEWWVHSNSAHEVGIDPSITEAIRLGESPVIRNQDEAEVYEFARQIHTDAGVQTELYDLVSQRHGVRGTVELTAVIGYYFMVAITLNVFEIRPDTKTSKIFPTEGILSLAQAQKPDGMIWDFATPAFREKGGCKNG